MTFNLKAGKTYYYYCQGSKPMVYGIYLNAPVANADSLLKEETATGGSGSDTQEASDKSVKLTWTAVDNDTEVYYGVDTYVDGVKVDMIDGIKDTSVVIDRLSSGVEYTFMVYVSEKANTANSLKAGNNKTYLGKAVFTTDGNKDTSAIAAGDNTEVKLASAIYTCAQATWTGISKNDTRVRGYKIYANGKLVKTLYNYQINNYKTANNISNQVGRLTPGIDNKVQIVAFTDAGVEYKYPEATVKTLENYDYKAPVWGSDAKLTAKENEAGDIVITWDAAKDDTKVGGYRVYLDGIAYGSDKYFNPVNGAKTTEETTYTIKKENLPEGFKASDAHTVTIQAGDTWWKAETTMGAFDKMAGFNWTNKGLSTTVENYKPEPGKPDDGKKDDTTVTKPDDGKKDDTTVTTPDNGNNAADDAATGSTTDTTATTATTPKTGDTNTASMWMLLAIMGMAGIAFVTAKKRSLVRK